MREILTALQTITDSSVMTPKQRREFQGLINEGFAIEREEAAAATARRAKIDNAVLPECDTFAGTGQRCGSCRIHKNNHA